MRLDGSVKTAWSLILLCSSALSLPGCSGGGGDAAQAPAPPPPCSATLVPGTPTTVTLSPNESCLTSLPVIGASAFMFIADGDSGKGPVISNVTGPSGQVLITPDPSDLDPIGKTLTAFPFNSVNTFLFPQTPLNGITPLRGSDVEHTFHAQSSLNDLTGGSGNYAVSIVNQNAQTQTIRIHSIVNPRSNPTGGTVRVNFILCGHPNFTIADINNPNVRSPFRDAVARFQALSANAGLIVQDMDIRLFECDPPTKARFRFIYTEAEIAALHKLSARIQNNGLNFVFVEQILGDGGGTILGQSAGIPGPAIQGTGASGVLVATLGDPAFWNASEWTIAGNTMAHEGGHFLGLFHPTERCGADPTTACPESGLRTLPAWFHVDPIPDTPACPSSRDTNRDGILSPEECGVDFGGTNVMFWQADPSLDQNVWTQGQRFVLHRNPFVQ